MDLIFKDLKVCIGNELILKNVCGMVKQGEMLAVMGPSGAGKSTLLNALSGNIQLTDGEILVNDQPINKQFRRKFAYVFQQDVFFPNLTLRETLTFYAKLKLPERMPNHLKLQRVEEILSILELTKCAGTAIGNATVPGLSGGEKKRANIACDLLINPLVLLIDEPTTGLDSTVAYNLIKTLNKYSVNMEKTVVTTIHQPSSRIFHIFHNLLLIVDGKATVIYNKSAHVVCAPEVAYFGAAGKVLDFFSNLGLHCMPHSNHADFILDKICEDPELTNQIVEESEKQRTTHWPLQLQNGYIRKKEAPPGNLNEGFVNDKDINLAPDTMINKSRGTIMNTDVHLDLFYDPELKWLTGFWTQFTTLFRRNLKQSSRRVISKMNAIEIIANIIMTGLAWFQIERDEKGVRDLMGMVIFVLIRWTFMTTYDGIFAFTLHRDVIDRERTSGIYRLSAFYCSVMVSEILFVCIRPLILYTLVYWISGLAVHPIAFFSSVAIFGLFVIAIQSVGIVIGIYSIDLPLAFMIGTTAAAFGAIFSGYFRTNFPVWLDWVRYISLLNYGFQAILKVDFKYGQPFSCASANETIYHECLHYDTMNQTATINNESIMKMYKMETPIWGDVLALLAFVVIFRLAGYVILSFRSVKKQLLIAKKKM